MSVSLIPDSAPFTEEQRAWLNGFLAGWTGIVDSANGAHLANGAEVATALLDVAPEPAAEEEEDFPWHDPAIEIDERLEMAKDRPIERRMMAAMAQLNCGACGYVCQTYSEAIADGSEKNLTLCSPGGKDTAKMLKKLAKEAKSSPESNGQSNGKANGHSNGHTNGNGTALNGASNGFSRSNPFTARLKSSFNLNLEGSAKHTSHVVIDLGESGLDYRVGDSLGVYPTNCDELVNDIFQYLDTPDPESLRSLLMEKYCLRSVTDELIELMASKCDDSAQKQSILQLIDADELDEMDVLDALRKCSTTKLPAAEFVESLSELAPRLYSIASSHNANPGEVHLTVGRATATIGERTYKGVASTMFADRVSEGAPVRVYVHPSHGFTVPADPNAPMIMVGPGTGIAPFRAFLQERCVTGATGKNWLFFGDQRASTDFLYRTEFDELIESGKLNKLSVAFSRDQEQKIYVQDRMREEGAELFSWLEQGGYFFVCGDAKRMAADVDRALHEVVETHGNMTPEDAKAYVEKLKSNQRYMRDVY
ncbi:sulfite reductase subunit alpha [Aeoliella sp.]|uniref:sulfite reductase subunit alpha n=1 Tax=Aeoliella sp. TaxID=2795800 RepID=UPI003CCBDAAD